MFFWSLSLSRVFWFVGVIFGLFCRDFSSFLYLHFALIILWFFCMIPRFGSVSYFFSLMTDSHSHGDSGNERFRKISLLCLTACTLLVAPTLELSCPGRKKKSKVVRRLPGFSHLDRHVITIMVFGGREWVYQVCFLSCPQGHPLRPLLLPTSSNIKCFKIYYF